MGDEDMAQAFHNDIADDLLDESAEQVEEVTDSDNLDIIDIEGGERRCQARPQTITRYRPLKIGEYIRAFRRLCNAEQ